MRSLLFTLCLLIALLGFPAPALAHAVQTNYLITPEALLETQTKYSNGEPLRRASVKIYSPADPSKPWMESVTDGEGRFAFLPDRSLTGDWMVEIGQSDHADALTLKVSDRGVEIAPDVPERQSQGSGKQFWVVGFAILCGGLGTKLGTKLFSRRLGR
jgi:nickel transport protein